jgi:hypothetical protein
LTDKFVKQWSPEAAKIKRASEGLDKLNSQGAMLNSPENNSSFSSSPSNASLLTESLWSKAQVWDLRHTHPIISWKCAIVFGANIYV